MGHSQSKAEGNTISEYRPDYEVVKTTDDPNYGHIKLVREKKTHQQMILKDFVFNTKQAFEEELKFFRDRASADHAHIVQVIGYHTTQAQNLCSAHFKVAVFIEVLPNELQSSLKERTRNNRSYPESDVLLIAENVISALHHLKTKNMVHGDIRPVNIFISGQSYKVNDPRLESDKNSNALTKAIIEKTQTLLAPELLVKVPTGKFETKEDIAKADVFSLGATLLNVATLKRSEELYDYRTGKIDEHLLMDRLEEVRAKYSPFTYQLISDMLRIHEHDRPSFADLNQRLLPFHESIHRRADLHHDDHHGGGIVHHQGERVKRSALPVDHHHDEVHTPQVDFHHVHHHEPPQFHQVDTDDLDARIRAALQRSAETYKQVQFVDSQHVHGIESRPPVVNFGGPTTTEFSHVHIRQEEKPRHEEGERKLKSSVPGLGLEHHHSAHFGGHEGFRPSGGEHIVRSTPPAYTPVETHHHDHIVRSTLAAYTPIETYHHDHIGGTAFGHEGFRPTGGEHVVRSTLPAHTVTETHHHDHIGEPTFGHEDEYAARTTYPAYIATELESGHIAVRQHGHIAEQAPRTSFTNPNDNVASFNYALGGSPQRQRTTFTTTSPGRDTQRTTYGQAPVVTQEYHFSADKGYHGTGRVEPGYPGVEVNEVVRPHTETERVVKAFHTGDDSANIHRVTYPSGSPAVNRYEITNIHDDYPRGNTVGYTGGYGAPTYGHENIQFGVENQGDGFRETGTSVHRFSHVEQGNNEDPLFESDPARYI